MTRAGRNVAVIVIIALFAGSGGVGWLAAAEQQAETGGGQAQAGPRIPRHLTVSAASVSGGGRNDALADFFAKRLGMGREFRAKRARDCAWHEVPDGCDPGTHVNLLQLKFGQRLELLAMMPDREGGTVALAARAPALLGQKNKYGQAYEAPAGDYQLPENAPADLVANFAAAFEVPPRMKGTYQLVLNRWGKGSEEDAGTDARPGEAWPGDDPEVSRMYPLAAAALYAEYYQASTRPQEKAIVLSVSLEVLTHDIRAALYHGDKKVHELTRSGIRYEQLYDGLRILFLNLIEWQGAVVEFSNPGLVGLRPLFVESVKGKVDRLQDDSVLISALGTRFVALNTTSGELAWQTPERKEAPTLFHEHGQLFMCDATGLAKISPSDGTTEFTVEVAGVDSARRFDARQELTAVGVFHTLALYRLNKELWKVALPWTIEAGPAIHGESVLVGDAKGHLRELSLQGEERWRLQLPKPIRGEIRAADDLFFGCDEHGTLFAISDRGELAWQAEIGEVLLGVPQIVDDAVLVASKSRQLLLLEKATGRRRKAHAFKSWLLGSHVIGDKVFCIDLKNRLSVFDVRTLRLERELRFPFALNHDILEVKDFSLAPQQLDLGLGLTAAGVLLSDVKGYLYLCPIR